MVQIDLVYSCWVVAISADTVHFDLNDPKILLGLIIGGILPYVFPVIPATFTKWLFFRTFLRNISRPSTLRLCAVGAAEPVCLWASVMASQWVYLPDGFSIFPIAAYPVLALFPNLFLFPSLNRQSAGGALKICICAFALGLIYLFCLFLFGLAFYAWLYR